MSANIKLFLSIIVSVHVVLSNSHPTDFQQKNNYRAFSVNVIADDNNMLWLGTTNGLIKFDKQNGVQEVFDTENSDLPTNDISALAIDKNKNIWIGCNSNIAKFNNNNWTVYDSSNLMQPYDKVTGIAIDSDGKVICAKRDSLFIYDGSIWTKIAIPDTTIIRLDITSIAIDERNHIWVGVRHSCGYKAALRKYDGEKWFTYEFIEHKQRSGSKSLLNINILSSNKIFMTYHYGSQGGSYSYVVQFYGNIWRILKAYGGSRLALDKNGGIWNGVNGKGLEKYNGPDTEWQEYIVPTSVIPDIVISALLIDSNNVKWIGTSSGLLRFDDNEWKLFDLLSVTGNKNKVAADMTGMGIKNHNSLYTIYFTTLRSMQVNATIYNCTGKKIKTLCNKRVKTGYHEIKWDFLDYSGTAGGSGIYLVNLKSEKFSTGKVIHFIK